MKSLSQFCALALFAIAGTTQAAPTTAAPQQGNTIRLAVALEPTDPESNSGRKAIAVELALSKAMSRPARIEFGSLRTIAASTRSGDLDALWVPSNLAASAMKNAGYEIYGYDGRKLKYALVVDPTIKSYADMRGRTLYLPQEDSAASIVGVALLSDNNIRMADFSSIYATQYGSYEVAALAVEKGFARVSTLPAPIAQAVASKSTSGVRVLAVSNEVPGQTLVVKKTLNDVEKRELATFFATLAGVPALVPMKPEDMKYVTGLTHYTPEEVPGVTKVGAKQVQELMGTPGVEIYDVRTRAEYDAKHLPGAKLLPYSESSPRFVGADTSADQFDVTTITAKKVVLYCNGPECWKSFKAAQKAIASKRFEAVYWFRGGMPEWERTGQQIARQ